MSSTPEFLAKAWNDIRDYESEIDREARSSYLRNTVVMLVYWLCSLLVMLSLTHMLTGLNSTWITDWPVVNAFSDWFYKRTDYEIFGIILWMALVVGIFPALAGVLTGWLLKPVIRPRYFPNPPMPEGDERTQLKAIIHRCKEVDQAHPCYDNTDIMMYGQAVICGGCWVLYVVMAIALKAPGESILDAVMWIESLIVDVLCLVALVILMIPAYIGLSISIENPKIKEYQELLDDLPAPAPKQKPAIRDVSKETAPKKTAIRTQESIPSDARLNPQDWDDAYILANLSFCIATVNELLEYANLEVELEKNYAKASNIMYGASLGLLKIYKAKPEGAYLQKAYEAQYDAACLSGLAGKLEDMELRLESTKRCSRLVIQQCAPGTDIEKARITAGMCDKILTQLKNGAPINKILTLARPKFPDDMLKKV